jgi:hypothetical protein
MFIPKYPDFSPFSIEMKNELEPYLAGAQDGISEFTFSGLYLFRRRYGYQFSSDGDGTFIYKGSYDGKDFFSCPAHFPKNHVLQSLFAEGRYWKNISQHQIEHYLAGFAENGIEITEDRDNFDYLYLARDLADLSGKKFHKKRNLVNAFALSYPNHEEFPLTFARFDDAMSILERWKSDKGEEGDYIATKEALELMETLNMEGLISYIDGSPAAFCLGEALPNREIFAIHFEKGIDEYKGIYQFINQAFAQMAMVKYKYLNREQDLGDEGMRQAKMTYRPVDVVKKYHGALKTRSK